MSEDLLMIFTRNPELGKVKTRLAREIGDDAALEIYALLLNHTREVSSEIKADKQVHYSVQIRDKDGWDPNVFQKKQQTGNDLGKRMLNAFRNGFEEGYSRIVIIGSDLYDLRASDIENAFEALGDHDVVLGPAKDGGYYLLGLTRVIPELFQDKAWGTNTVLQQSLNDLTHIKTYLLEPKNDIDRVEDILDIPVFQKYRRNKLSNNQH